MESKAPFFIQLSDTHLFADPLAELWDVEPDAMLDCTIGELARIDAAPAFVLVTGDCSSDGSLASYRRLAQKLQFGAPVYYLPGNHDDSDLMARTFAGRAPSDDGKFTQVFDSFGWRFVLLDSSIPGEEAGSIGQAQLQWLAQSLDADRAAPTVVAVHHQPVPIGSQWLDAMAVLDAGGLLSVLDRAPQIRAVLFGHVHQDFSTYRGATLYCSAPSTFFQFKPNWPVFAADGQPPGARIVRLEGDGLSTSIVRAATATNRLSSRRLE